MRLNCLVSISSILFLACGAVSADTLYRGDWVLSSSNNAGILGRSIDSSASTRWDTGTRQTSGQHVQIDLGETNTINRIELNSEGSRNDYPRGYEVYASTNGSNWGQVIASGKGSVITTIIFKPVSVRYIKIVQTGSDSRFWWSIHDLNIFDSGSNCTGTYDLPNCMAAMSSNGGGTIVLANKTYKLTESLILKDNVNIVGQSYSSVITWDDSVKDSVNAPLLYAEAVNNISLVNFKLRCHIDQDSNSRDLRNDHMGLFLEGAGDPSQGEATSNNDLYMASIEAMYCSNGMHIKGATGVTGIDLKLHNNGNTETDLFHNIYLRRVADIVLKQTNDTSGGYYASPRGHGIRLSHIDNAYFENVTVRDNADHGIHASDGIYDMRFHEVDIYGNCANPSGSCAQLQCYSGGGANECDIEEGADKE